MRTAGICSNKRKDYNSFWMLEYDVYEIKIGLIFKANLFALDSDVIGINPSKEL